MKTFYLAPEDWNEPYVLTGGEARHILKAVRLQEGDQVRLFDGQGREGVFTISGHSKTEVHLLQESETIRPEPATRVHLAMGWAKGLRRGWLLEKSVELECAGLWLWQAQRSQGKVPSKIKEAWEAKLISGAKQCRNPRLPEIRTLKDGLKGVIEASREFTARFVLWEDQEHDVLLGYDALRVTGDILFVIGPEGGITPKELDTLTRAGMAPVSLGKSVLRWETASLLCLGLAWWANQGAE